MGVIGTQPDVLREQREILNRQKRLALQSHDGLCIVNTREWGASSCWCMKACCWLWFDTPHLRITTDEEGKETVSWERIGTCICQHCDCPDTRFFRGSRMRLA